MSTETKRRPRLWKILTPEDKKGMVRVLLKAGYTREAIGKALGTTKNAIVGFQHRRLPKLTGNEGTLHVVPEGVLRRLASSVWPAESEPAEREDVNDAIDRLVEPKPPGEAKLPKMAQREEKRCAFRNSDGHQCALEWTDPIAKRCDAHKKLR